MVELKGRELTDDERQFVEQLYREHGSRLISNYRRLVGSDGAGDVVQEVFFELITKPKYLEDLRGYDREHREGWLFLTAYRKALRQLERWKRTTPTGETPERADPEDAMDRWLRDKHAATLMAQVRQTFDGRDLALLGVSLDVGEKAISYAQAAVELGMEVDAVRQAVHRMVDPQKGYLRGAVLAVYLHDTQGGGCKSEKLRKAVSGELNTQLRIKVVRHVAGCEDCQNTRRQLPILAGVRGALPLLLPPPHVYERLVREVGYATSTLPEPPAGAGTGAGEGSAATSPAVRTEATRPQASTSSRVLTRRRRRSLLSLLLLLLIGMCADRPTYASHPYQYPPELMTGHAAPDHHQGRTLPSNTQPTTPAPTGTAAVTSAALPANTSTPPILSNTPTPTTAPPSTTVIAETPGPTTSTSAASAPSAISTPPESSPPATSTTPSPTTVSAGPKPAIGKPLATTTPCGLHITAAVANATSSAVNYLVFGAGPAIVVPLHGTPAAADLYPADRPGPEEYTENYQVTWWISATNGTRMVFTPGVTQTVAVCEHVVEPH